MIISKESTKENEHVKNRIDSIKEQLRDKYKYTDPEINLLQYRLRQLSGGIAILRVGGATESELLERHDRVDDALNATKSALQEGILPGGGVALTRCTQSLKSLAALEVNPDIKAGIQIMIKSITRPFMQIIENGQNSSEKHLDKIENKSLTTGYDARKNIFGDMYKLGIVDPHKVVRCAIENAVSAASMLLTIGCCIVEVKDKNLEDNYI